VLAALAVFSVAAPHRRAAACAPARAMARLERDNARGVPREWHSAALRAAEG